LLAASSRGQSCPRSGRKYVTSATLELISFNRLGKQVDKFKKHIERDRNIPRPH
jgi:hypothetical protein